MTDIPVPTQADRDAAVHYLRSNNRANRRDAHSVFDGILAGKVDELPIVQAFARHAQAARKAAFEEALECQPSTAENPNEDARQRGRFGGIMEFATAIRARGDAL